MFKFLIFFNFIFYLTFFSTSTSLHCITWNLVNHCNVNGYCRDYEVDGVNHPVCVCQWMKTSSYSGELCQLQNKVETIPEASLFIPEFSIFSPPNIPINPHGIRFIDDNNILIAGYQTHVILKYNINTKVLSHVAGTFFINSVNDGIGNNAKFSGPNYFCFEKHKRWVYIVDYLNKKIRKMTLDTFSVTTIKDFTLYPTSCLISDNNHELYVTFLNDTNNFIRYNIDNNGNLLNDFEKKTLNGIDKPVTMVREDENNIRIVENGLVTSYFDNNKIIEQLTDSPQDMEYFGNYIFYTNRYSGKFFRKNILNGDVELLIGKNGQGDKDGLIDQAKIDQPVSFSIQPGSTHDNINIYIADYQSNKIKHFKYFPNNYHNSYIETINMNSNFGFVDGSFETAQFNHVQSIRFISPTKALIADYMNHKIRLMDLTSKTITTVAGSVKGEVDGIGLNAQLFSPNYICVDKNNEWVGITSFGGKIRKMSLDNYNVTTLMDAEFSTGCSFSNDNKYFYHSSYMDYIIKSELGDNLEIIQGKNKFFGGFLYPTSIIECIGNIYVAETRIGISKLVENKQFEKNISKTIQNVNPSDIAIVHNKRIFTHLRGEAHDGYDIYWVSRSEGKLYRMRNDDGKIEVLIGNNGKGDVDGLLHEAKLMEPGYLTVKKFTDPNLNPPYNTGVYIYIADVSTKKIKKVTIYDTYYHME